MSLSTLRVARFPISILISALVVVGLLLFPGPAFGVQSVTTTVTGTSFPLGTPIPGTVTIALEADEFIGLATGFGSYNAAGNAATVMLDVVGPQSVSFNLPLVAGSFTITRDGATLTGTVTHTGVSTGDFTGYGYGYGYKAGSTGGSIDIDFQYTGRILLDPAPFNLPPLPQTQDILQPINLAGAEAGATGPSAGAGIPPFPEFSFLGEAGGMGVPFDAEARALDARISSGKAILAVILDGDVGQNDVYAEFEVGFDQFGAFVFPRTSFNLPNVGVFNMGALQGLTFIDSNTIAVSGGEAGGGDDSFVAIFNFTADPPTAANVSTGPNLDLSQLLDQRTGGVAFDGTNLFVSEFQTDPGGQVTIAMLSLDLTSTVTSFDTPLGFAGAGGFDGFASDPNSENRFFGVTEPPNFGFGPEDVRILEFDDNGTPLATHTPSGIPMGQSVTGLGMIDNEQDSGNSSLMFAVTRNREIMVTAVAATAAGPSGGGQFTNEPQAIDFDSTNNRYLIPVMGAGNSHLAIIDRDLVTELDRFELNITNVGVDFGEIGGATYVEADDAYWLVGAESPPVIRKLNLSTKRVEETITLPFFVGQVGALASSNDGTTTFLYAYEVFNDAFHKINTTTGTMVSTVNVFDSNYNDQYFPPFGATGATIGDENGTERLFISRFNQVFTVDLASGALLGGFTISATDLMGLGNGSLLMADRGFGSNKIMASRLPGQKVSETTTVGSYTMTATVNNTEAGANQEFAPAITSAQASFTLTKLDAVVITLTTPDDGAAFISSPILVEGTVNDPTVTQVVISAGLASGTIVGFNDLPSAFDDSVDKTQYTTTGLWRFEESAVPAMVSPTGSTLGAGTNGVAYYGKPGTIGSNPNYQTGFSPNHGNLDSPQFSVTGTDTTVVFDFWYATEPTPPPFGGGGGFGSTFDRKVVLWCLVGGGCSPLVDIVSFVPDPFNPFGGFFFEPPPGFLPPGVASGQTFNVNGQQAMFIPRERGGSLTSGGAQFTKVTVSLDGQNGETGFVRIKFDTVDDFNQSFEQQGLVVDNLQVTGPITLGDSNPVTGQAFSFYLGVAEGSNKTLLTANSAVGGTAQGTVTFTTILDTAAPILALDAVTSPTKNLAQTLTGTFAELSPRELKITRTNGGTTTNAAIQKTFAAGATTYSHTIGLQEGVNTIAITLTDNGGQTATVNTTIIVDNTGPEVSASIQPILSDSGVRGGDPFFVIVDATDTDTGIGSVVIRLPSGSALSLSHTAMAAVGDTPDVIVKKHELGTFASTTTTHVGLTSFGSGTPVGTQQIIIDATDGAGNVSTTTLNVSVVAALDNRSAYLSEGINYVGFPLVPTVTGVAAALNADVNNVNPALTAAMQTDQGRAVKLSDIVTKVWAYENSGTSGFLSFTPTAASPSFTTLAPFDGMIVDVAANVTVASVSYAVFDTGTVLGSTVKVPIKWNIGGVFQDPPPSLPPEKLLGLAWNLWTPHALNAGLFEDPGFLRAAVVTPPGNLAVSAITLISRIDAIADNTAPGGFDAEVESRFSSAGPGDTLELMRSYWTFLVGSNAVTLTP